MFSREIGTLSDPLPLIFEMKDNKHHMIDQQTSDKIIESYCNGHSFKSIAEYFDLSPTAVRNQILLRGIISRPRGRPKGSFDMRPRERKDKSSKPKIQSVSEKRIERAISRGFLSVKELCDFCGSPDDVRYEFDEPAIYDLRWRCQKHRKEQ